MEKDKEYKERAEVDLDLYLDLPRWDRRVSLLCTMLMSPLLVAAGGYVHMLSLVILGAASFVWGVTSFFLARSREKKFILYWRSKRRENERG